MITLNKPVLSVCLVGLVLFLIVPVYSHEDSSASERHFSDSTYCLLDSECAIREGACGPEPMNIYFDNTPLIEQQAYVDCMEFIAYSSTSCQNNKCEGITRDGP